ncbi:MAG: hypothetical protein ACRD72_23820, partial [Candidatus Angelobacter sp.]
MDSESVLLELVGKIYECAVDPLGWNDFLAAAARFGGATIAALAYNDNRRDEHFVSSQYGIPPEFQGLYC